MLNSTLVQGNVYLFMQKLSKHIYTYAIKKPVPCLFPLWQFCYGLKTELWPLGVHNGCHPPKDVVSNIVCQRCL